MLSRRKFFSSLLMLPAISAGIASAEILKKFPKKPADKELRGEFYRGYDIRFTGWKESQNTDTLTGQWVAYPTKRHPEFPYVGDYYYPYLYASVPGAEGPFCKGATFNIAASEHQVFISWKDRLQHPEMLEMEKENGRQVMFKMIDSIMDSGKQRLSMDEWTEIVESGKREYLAYLRRRMQELRKG